MRVNQPQPGEVTVGFKARPWQRPLVEYFRHGGKKGEGGRRASVVAHRRAGKDRAALFIELEQALRSPREVWHALPSYKQARKVIWDAITGDGGRLIDVAFPAAIVKRRIEDEMKIELANGSLWRLVGADAFDSLVGSNPRHVTFSEYALTSPRSREFVRPILAENGGTELYITTPRGYNHAHDLHEFAKNAAPTEWYSALHPVSQTQLIDEETLAGERASMPDELYRQEYECDFSAANVGSIVGRYIEQAGKEGRIREGPLYDPLGAGIHLVSDIGFRDAAAWWWVQPCPGGFRIIDHDEDNGLDAEEWIERLRAHPWPIETLWLPHDARAKTFRSRLTVVDVFMHSGLAQGYRIVPQTSIADRINAARMFVRRCDFDRARCAKGLISLREWKFKYDEERHAFSASPDHDEHSHSGDAFSYCGVALREAVLPEEVKRNDSPILVPAHYAFNLDMLYEEGLGHGDRSEWA